MSFWSTRDLGSALAPPSLASTLPDVSMVYNSVYAVLFIGLLNRFYPLTYKGCKKKKLIGVSDTCDALHRFLHRM